MIDTIHFNFESSDIHGVISESRWVRGSQYQKASIDSYQISEFLNINVIPKTQTGSKCLFRGSIHKFWQNGTNIHNFSFHDFNDAIKEVIKILGIKPQSTFITRLDYGHNLIMNHPIRGYNSLLVCPKGLNEDSYQNKQSMYFVNRKRNSKQSELTFYDKLEEVYPKKKIPSELKKKHLLRIEKRLLSLTELRNLNINTLQDLLKPKIQLCILKDWYESIKIMEFEGTPILAKVNSPQSVYEYLMAIGVHNLGGYENFRLMTKPKLDESPLSKSQIYRIRKKIEELPSHQKTKNRLASELAHRVQKKYLEAKNDLILRLHC